MYVRAGAAFAMPSSSQRGGAPCKSSSQLAIGCLLSASHAARPIVMLYVIPIILFYAPFALLSRGDFTQQCLGLCYESMSSACSFIPPRTHGSKSIRASMPLGAPSFGSCISQVCHACELATICVPSSVCSLSTSRRHLGRHSIVQDFDYFQRLGRQGLSNCAERRAAAVVRGSSCFRSR